MDRTPLGIALAAALLASPVARAAPLPPDRIRVNTDAGPLIGRLKPKSREFLGIPYAAPPVGGLRWKPPAPIAPWSAAREATQRGAACVQDDGGTGRKQSEDCLTLNVWVPLDVRGPLPVLFWIHGGGFYQGSGTDGLYDGQRLATRAQAIVVTINYRVGALGFLSHRDLAKEAGVATYPSVGILDQRAALGWVQRNIASFGGDPKRVTIVGESAGAWSVCTHLASPRSHGLFARAIMQSGACSDALYFDGKRAEQQADELVAAVGCRDAVDRLGCLRGKSPHQLMLALPFRRGMLLKPGVWWGPVVDGTELPRLPLDAMRAGQSAPVPLVIGWNRDEGILHTLAFAQNTPAELDWFVRDVFGDAAPPLVLPSYARPTPKAALTDIVTDGIFACNARRVARALADRDVPVYLYEWTHALDAPKPHRLGATHSVELFFLFGNPDMGVSLSVGELPLSRLMMDLWGQFARDGVPTAPRLKDKWPRYATSSDEHFVLDLPPSKGKARKREVCDLWDRVDGLRAR